ncbi:hypothetical protein [uncultured Desulfuromonas sp.]|uniref:hypothetical protein n=1 Tax=uncultured Desulfuromonas sp. TaxID=181013 RepID=UPI002AAAC976|nr:hypothetical protein [uncultured Desulfuromonas sp.]
MFVQPFIPVKTTASDDRFDHRQCTPSPPPSKAQQRLILFEKKTILKKVLPKPSVPMAALATPHKDHLRAVKLTEQ